MRGLRLVVLLLLACCLASAAALAATTATTAPRAATPLRVKNSTELASALRNVGAGGVVEMAAGTYPAPAKGFAIGTGKTFTLRAAAGAQVAIDGLGKGPLLSSKGKMVTFQNLTFRNGASAAEGVAGGVTLTGGAARFEGCNFLGNKGSGLTTGGGAVRMTGSTATFVNSNFRDNSSANRGGAVEAVASVLTLQGGQLTNNCTNLPNHKKTSVGGALYVLNSQVAISDAHFEANQTSWAGGAIDAFGIWGEPIATPKTVLTVIRSTFTNNRAQPDPCCVIADPTSGGAIHVEDQTTLRVFSSQFFDNVADNGGALDGYRAILEVNGSLFRNNRTPALAGRLGVGGAIQVASNDSGVDGANNRRPGRLTVADSLFQGAAAGTGAPAQSGGCVSVEGDWSRLYGIGIAANGGVPDNRATAELRRSAFADCDVEKTAAGGGMGGAVSASLADLVLDGSLLFDSDARGDVGGGGGLALQRESNGVITGTTFAHDTADKWGGAVFLQGSTAQVSGCRFLRNEVSPGSFEPLNESRGAAFFAIPQLGGGQFPPHDVGGLVTNSVFADNLGIPLWDVEPTSGPVNEMRYDSNQIYGSSFGSLIYVNTAWASTGLNAAGLNSLNIYHPGLAALDKGNGNEKVSSRPATGALLAVPPSLGTGAPPAPESYLAYAWSGGNASLAGQTLSSIPSEKDNLLPTTAAGSYTLTVDGAAQGTVQVAPTPPPPPPGTALRRWPAPPAQ